VLDRYITAPDGIEWVIGRRFLFGPPRYIGFRFGRPKIAFEPPRIRRVPPTSRPPQSPAATVRRREPGSVPDGTGGPVGAPRRNRSRYRHSSGTIFVPLPSGRGWGHWSGGTSGGSWGGSSSSSGGSSGSGGGSSSRSGGGSSSRSGGGSSSRGGGGAAAGGLVGLGGFLVKFLQIALIVIAIAAATVFTIFVLIPALIFLCWALLVGVAIAWHTVTDRPWIVGAREHRDAPDVRAWAVVGWAQSRQVIDEVADAIASGSPPNPAGATRVDVVEDADLPGLDPAMPAAESDAAAGGTRADPPGGGGPAERDPAGRAGVADPVTG
jgi:hypothetical protein